MIRWKREQGEKLLGNCFAGWPGRGMSLIGRCSGAANSTLFWHHMFIELSLTMQLNLQKSILKIPLNFKADKNKCQDHSTKLRSDRHVSKCARAEPGPVPHMNSMWHAPWRKLFLKHYSRIFTYGSQLPPGGVRTRGGENSCRKILQHHDPTR